MTRRLLWFLGLYIAGVAATLIVASALKAFLPG
jgi:hypothetical protein